MRTSPVPRSLSALAAGAALALALTGCAGLPSSGGTDDGGTENAAAGSGAGTTAATKDVAGKGTWPYGEHRAEATWEVNELRRRGKLLQLTLTVTPERPATGAERKPSLYDLFGTYTVALIDTENLRRHTVVEDDERQKVAPDLVRTKIAYGKPTTVSYTFAAPPKGIGAMDVYIAEFPPITDVPVSG